MLDKAERKLIKTPKNCQMQSRIDISREAQIVRKRIASNIDKFFSLQEVMVAIQLEHQKITYETQKEIKGRKVDFFLPDKKIILEIDGGLYHTDENKEFLRDRKIMQGVGGDYEIVHIEAESVPRYTWNLKEALEFIIDQRKEYGVFRDSRWDEYLLEQFRNMELFIGRRERHDNKGIFITNKQI